MMQILNRLQRRHEWPRFKNWFCEVNSYNCTANCEKCILIEYQFKHSVFHFSYKMVLWFFYSWLVYFNRNCFYFFLLYNKISIIKSNVISIKNKYVLNSFYSSKLIYHSKYHSFKFYHPLRILHISLSWIWGWPFIFTHHQ